MIDWSTLGRLVPPFAAAVVVGWLAVRDRDIEVPRVADAALEVVVMGVIAARLAWIVVEGRDSVARAPGTALLVRSGVETWIGVGAATAWAWWRWSADKRTWALVAAPPALLAGLAAWQASCGIEGVCAGVPVTWGVSLPGYLHPVFPAGYVEASAAALLALAAYRWRHVPAIAIGAVATYALVRAGLGFARAPLAGLPTRDQVLSLLAALLLATIALRLRRSSGSALRPTTAA
jgi:prolipoprotein diacylglyceryltransferase